MKPPIRNKTTLRRKTKKHIPDKELLTINNKTKIYELWLQQVLTKIKSSFERENTQIQYSVPKAMIKIYCQI